MNVQELMEESETLYCQVAGPYFRFLWSSNFGQANLSIEIHQGPDSILSILGRWAAAIGQQWAWEISAVLTQFVRDCWAILVEGNKESASSQ